MAKQQQFAQSLFGSALAQGQAGPRRGWRTFAPAAWQAYQGLPDGALSDEIKRALERLAADPAAVRADPRSRRHRVIEEQLPQAAQVWSLPVDAPGAGHWLVVWREPDSAIEIGYIGPAPGDAAE